MKKYLLLSTIFFVFLTGCSKEDIAREEYLQIMSEELAYIYHADDYFTDILDVHGSSFYDYLNERDKIMKMQEKYHENLNTVKNRLDHIERFYNTYEIPEEFQDISQDFPSLYRLVINNIEEIEVNNIDWDNNEAWDNTDYSEVVDLKLEIIDDFYNTIGLSPDEEVKDNLWCRFAISCNDSN